MVELIRTYSHQLTGPCFDDAQELVSYMGAVQGQDIEMSKWAVGMRLQSPSLSHIRQALDSGRIIRTHILRTTWHLVSADDIRWMLDLCGGRLLNSFMNYWGKHYGIDGQTYRRFCDAAAKALSGTSGLTVQELTSGLSLSGAEWSADQVKCMLTFGEVDGLFCNGCEKERKHTYALLDERVPASNHIPREEALALLAFKYFRSHSPASPEDFIWWSGLTGTEAKRAISSISGDLITDRYEGQKLYVHRSAIGPDVPEDGVHLLPPYDEYLISYKDRSHVLPPKYSAKAHNSFGIFHPVILHRGKVVGNWKKVTKKDGVGVETSFFTKSPALGKRKLQTATERYTEFLKG